MNFQQIVLFSLCNLFFFLPIETLKPGECEVCIKELEIFMKTLSSETKNNETEIAEEFKKFCKNSRSKRERLCYYMGGSVLSATNILLEMAKPLKRSLPADKICEKLKKIDSQICDLKYEKMIDLAKTNLKKLKVKDLKKILSEWGEDQACKGCAEKSDFIKVIEELMPVYAPEAHASRKKAEL